MKSEQFIEENWNVNQTSCYLENEVIRYYYIHDS